MRLAAEDSEVVQQDLALRVLRTVLCPADLESVPDAGVGLVLGSHGGKQTPADTDRSTISG